MDDDDTGTGTDRISALPDPIIHHIWSFLTADEVVRTSILSKAWLNTWSTNPCLVFKERRYSGSRFYEYVDQIMSRYQNQNLPIDSLCLDIAAPRLSILKDDAVITIDKWLRISLQNRVKVISLTVHPRLSYSLPIHVFLSHYKFDNNFSQLRKLRLVDVHLDEHMVSELFSVIPLLQDLTLSECRGFRTLKVANLDNLKFLDIRTFHGSTYFQTVEIYSTRCLESFIYATTSWNDDILCSPMPNLTRMYLTDNTITDDSLPLLIAQCPLLNELELQSCYYLKNIEISSNSLKTIKVRRCPSLKTITFNAPNLISFEYYSPLYMLPFISFTNAPSALLKVVTRTDITWPSGTSLGNEFFLTLWHLLRNANTSHVTLNIHNWSPHWSNPHHHPMLINLVNAQHHVPNKVDALMLDAIYESPSIFPSLVDKLLSLIHPKFIYITCGKNIQVLELVKFLHLNLIANGDNATTCHCFLYPDDELYRELWLPNRKYVGYNKQWTHYLKRAELEFHVRDEVWEPLDYASLEDASNFIGKSRRLRFRFDWF